MLYLVTQVPKGKKNRAVMTTLIVVIEAATKKAAICQFEIVNGKGFADCFCKPVATPLSVGKSYFV